ncbi:MAG: Unknown protein [uncultured Sulfurovum sp.]|uniref:DUF2459 domain-containing protein n=1 Tax=uncultured Sulfurovum sp. TaxID=269237 RepID=A0A6S6T9E0_9BACT|nr:MAG: Unknown protein [uncultured Sulfurovum sp.]
MFTLFPKKSINYPEQTKKVYILHNDLHSDIVFNIKELNISKFEKFKNKKFGYLSFGWGDKETYLNTLDIKDIKISTTLKALLINSPSLMHVSYLKDIHLYKNVKTIRLSKAQQKVLKKSILNTFNFQGTTYKGYAQEDIFYTAKGKYNLIDTCNTWTGDKLREVNVSMSHWTPFSWSVTTNLP